MQFLNARIAGHLDNDGHPSGLDRGLERCVKMQGKLEFILETELSATRITVIHPVIARNKSYEVENCCIVVINRC